MTSQQNISIPLKAGNYYHIFNRGNNFEPIFYKEENYLFFLKKFNKYCSNYLDVYAYCLMKNHFHFLVKIKPEKDINNAAKIDFKNFENFTENSSDKIISERLRRFFLSYAKAINKQEVREGSLFRKYFRRKHIDTDNYFKELISYIHNNPVHHKITVDFTDYKWTSYKSILSNKKTNLKRKEVIAWFDNIDNFIYYHRQKNLDYNNIEKYLIEE